MLVASFYALPTRSGRLVSLLIDVGLEKAHGGTVCLVSLPAVGVARRWAGRCICSCNFALTRGFMNRPEHLDSICLRLVRSEWYKP